MNIVLCVCLPNVCFSVLNLSDEASEWGHALPDLRWDSWWDQTSWHKHEAETVAHEWGAFVLFLMPYLYLLLSVVLRSIAFSLSNFFYESHLKSTQYLFFPLKLICKLFSSKHMLQNKKAIESKWWEIKLIIHRMTLSHLFTLEGYTYRRRKSYCTICLVFSRCQFLLYFVFYWRGVIYNLVLYFHLPISGLGQQSKNWSPGWNLWLQA